MKKDLHHNFTNLIDSTQKLKKIPNTNGVILKSRNQVHNCFFDPEYYKLINRFHWYLSSRGYAVTSKNGRRIYMHRLILEVDDPKTLVNHRNHNKLDNRRANIRICTSSEKNRNSRKLTPKSSKYKGVYLDNKYWHVQINEDRERKNLGRFRSEKTAAKVYDQKARELYKDFAFLNFPNFVEDLQLIFPGFL